MPMFPPRHETHSTAAPLEGVSSTALWTVRMRAEESARADALFHDALAATFLTGTDTSAAPPGSGLLQQVLPDWLAVRTRFFDDHLLATAHQGRRQVVLLGAGLDTRSYRLDWPDGTRVFEVDLPAVHTFKERVLAGHTPPAADRTPVPADLLAD